MYYAVFYFIIFDGKHMFSVISCSNSNFWENGINSYLYFLADRNFYLLAVGDFHKTVDFALGKLLADQNYESSRLPIESEKNDAKKAGKWGAGLYRRVGAKLNNQIFIRKKTMR